jgi:hypothetical protein
MEGSDIYIWWQLSFAIGCLKRIMRIVPYFTMIANAQGVAYMSQNVMLAGDHKQDRVAET